MKPKVLITISFFLFFLPLVGQEVYPDCVNPKCLTIPLSVDSTNNVFDEIYYQLTDKYTYWYKLDVKAACKINYQLEAINEEDDYEILIYNYTGNSFCDEVVRKKEQPIINKAKGTIAVNKGDVYYFGVLHINGYGCGHTLNINDGSNKITYKAIQNECVEEVLETIVENKKTNR